MFTYMEQWTPRRPGTADLTPTPDANLPAGAHVASPASPSTAAAHCQDQGTRATLSVVLPPVDSVLTVPTGVAAVLATIIRRAAAEAKEAA